MARWSVLFFSATIACNGPEDSDPADTDLPVDTDADTDLVDADGDGFLEGTDCNDDNEDIFPGAPELCNEVDDNCNDLVDDEAVDASVFYADADDDGFGDFDVTTDACEIPEGFVEDSTDCNDNDALVRPDAEELPCDNVDNNCDDSVDPGNIAINNNFDLAVVMENAADGALYCLAEGTYTGGAVITSAVTLVGVGDVVITGNDENILSFVDTDAHLYSLTISGNGRAFDVDGGSLTLTHVAISDIGVGELVSGPLDGAVGRVEYASLVADGLTVADVHVSHDDSVNGMFYVSGEGSEFSLDDFSITNNTVAGVDNITGVLCVGDQASVSLTNGEISSNGIAGEGVLVGTNAAGIWDHVLFVNNEMLGTGPNESWLMATHGDWEASHMVIADNAISAATGYVGGIDIALGTTSFTNVIFSGNHQNEGTLTYGWFRLTGANLSLTNVDILANIQVPFVYSGALFYANNWQGDTSLQLVNTAIAGNQFGEGAIDQGEGDFLWLSYGSVTETSTYFYENSYGAAFYESTLHPITEAEDEPGYVDTRSNDTRDWDLHLTDDSPLRDAGSALILDVDGSVSDIGAYGGPEGSW